jgi:NTP pyrophosphatase (non-canonical NTP hydrolase)
MQNYLEECQVTLSSSWHENKVTLEHFLDTLKRCIEAANDLDLIKKSLFYGRENGLSYLGSTPFTEQHLYDRLGDGNADPRNIVHGIIGNFTEAGELLEALQKALIDGDGFDPINMREEIGDQFWYIAILLFEAARDGEGYTFDDCMRVNIAKLRARYPEKFTEHDANNRDLTTERSILEQR